MKQFNLYQNPLVLQKDEKTILAYKPIGFTPLEAINYIKDKHQEYARNKLGYAGRLDPMAEGLLLLLIDEENKNKVEYERLTKTYKFSCTFGIETDTLDVLGVITHVDTNYPVDTIHIALQDKLQLVQGDVVLPYPLYSAKRVKGKPLYYWARRNKLQEITIPTVRVHISTISLGGFREITGKDLGEEAISRIQRVRGDFRQDEIINSWEKFMNDYSSEKFVTAEITAEVSAGTYIRSICQRLGQVLNTSAIATNINRIAIRDYTY